MNKKTVSKVGEILLQRFFPNLNDHLSDERMATLFCRELSFAEKWMAHRHLKKCPHCRFRQRYLEGPRARGMFQLYRDVSSDESIYLPAGPRAEFVQWLELRMHEAAAQERRSYRMLFTPRAVSIGVTIGVIAGVSAFFFWQAQRVPEVSTNAFLMRVAKGEELGQTVNSGVARQTVRIKTKEQTIDRSIYWDPQGTRKPKHSPLPGGTERLRWDLTRAGVDWDRPISAASYQAWHDQQHVHEDRVTRTGTHLLTLTTAVTDGNVAKESLTVRDTDFHPVLRTVDFLDNETVEIAELDYTVLPWSAIDTNVFEPIGNISRMRTAVEPSPSFVPDTSSPEQLDETELAARLILNQLHADTGEQIEIYRSSQEVEVDGLVETEARKRELNSQLMTVPRLKVSIQSVGDVQSVPIRSNSTASIQMASLPDHPSALDTYLRSRGHSIADINALAQKFFNNALRISQESRAIADLKMRFSRSEQASLISSATLTELIYSHHERLEDALQQERTFLAEAEAAVHSGSANISLNGLTLDDAAAKNLSLTKELTGTNVPVQRSAEEIFAEMSVIANELDATSRDVYGKPSEDTALSGKR